MLSTYARLGSSISGKGGASAQARRSNLTFLNGLFGSISISPDSLLHPCPRSRSGISASYTVGEKERGGWVGWGGGREGAWETLHKGLPNDFAPVMQGALGGDRVGVCCWLVCLIHHRAGGEEKHSAASRKSMKILPQHPEVSRLCKNISPR